MNNHSKEMVEQLSLAATASAIKRIYIANRSMREKRNCKLSSKDNASAVWKNAAVLCMAQGLNVDTYVQLMFEAAEELYGPYASQMGGEWAARVIRNYKKLYEDAAPALVPFESNMRLNSELHLIAKFLQRKAGTVDPLNPEVLRLLRAHHSGIPDYIRCLLGFFDDEVMTNFARSAWAFLCEKQADRDAFTAINPLAMEAIIKYGQ